MPIYLFESAETCQNRSSYPCGVFSLGRCKDFDLLRKSEKGGGGSSVDQATDRDTRSPLWGVAHLDVFQRKFLDFVQQPIPKACRSDRSQVSEL